jgi:tetratricopeptide (TPR) repeat protein
MLDDVNRPTVASIVRRLDGLPLAIELAAARVRTLSVQAIESRLDHALALLTGGARDLPARQQTLRGAIAWSHDLLDDAERRVFARTGLFAGGAALALAEQVCGDVDELGVDPLDGLDSLAAKSLLRATSDPRDPDEPRYVMLVTIREFALEQLAASGDQESTAMRFARAFLELADHAERFLEGPMARQWLDRLELENDNLRAALDELEANDDAEPAMRLATAVWRFWQIRGLLYEAEERFARILALPSAAAVSARIRARALGAAGSIAYWRADLAAMHRLYTEALAEAERCGDVATIADAEFNLGFAPTEDVRPGQTYFAQGKEHFERALGLYRELGDERGVGRAAWGAGAGAIYGDELDLARGYLDEALAQARKVEDRFYLGWSLHMIGFVDIAQGRTDDAAERFEEALRTFRATDDRTGVALVLFGFALLARARGDESLHWRLRGGVERMREATGADILRQSVPSVRWDYDERPTLPEHVAAWDEGWAMTDDELAALTAGMVASSG